MSTFLALAQNSEPTVGALPYSSDLYPICLDKFLLWSNAPCPQSLPAPETLSVTRELDTGLGRHLAVLGLQPEGEFASKIS